MDKNKQKRKRRFSGMNFIKERVIREIWLKRILKKRNERI